MGTFASHASYIDATNGYGRKTLDTEMKETGDILKTAAIVILALVVLFIAVPFVLAAVGIVFGFLVTLAIFLIRAAIVVAVIYLIVVGIRALLR